MLWVCEGDLFGAMMCHVEPERSANLSWEIAGVPLRFTPLVGSVSSEVQKVRHTASTNEYK